MINVVAVASIRTLPLSAEYGFSLLFFYLIAAVMFFIPSALISAELATGWPNTGGIYVWVREAFGKKASTTVIWLSWMYNIAWYPTIMALVAATSAYLIDPKLATDRIYLFSLSVILFWLATLVNCLGIRASSLVSSIGAILGTLFPMLFIILLAFYWYIEGNNLAIEFSWRSFLPTKESADNIGFLSSLLLGLLGLEMAATHAQEMKNPRKDYPKAVLISSIIIFFSLVLSSLAIAVIVPKENLSLVAGVLQAFELFFHSFGIPQMTPVVAFFIILGALSSVSTWIIGPSKGIMIASEDGSLPSFFSKKNKNHVPVNVLMTQAVIVTILSFAFIFLPSINASFWILSAITAELALVVYIALFAAGLVLHYKKRNVARSFKIPGENFGIWLVCCLGWIICVFAIFTGLIPPKNIAHKNLLLYEAGLITGMLLLSLAPLIYIYSKKKEDSL